jgi:hypothetical protein
MNKEIRIEKAWIYKGRKVIILWVGSHYCAYVETKLKNVGYDQEFGTYETSPSSNISAHGGLTFSGELKITPFEKDIWYFGVDFAHAGDFTDYSGIGGINCSLTSDEHKWTLQEVEKEAEQLVDEVIRYEKSFDKYKAASDKFKEELKNIKESS